MQNIIERHVTKQTNKTKHVLISMGFRQFRFLKIRHFSSYACLIFIAVRQKNSMYFGEVESLPDGKEKSRLVHLVLSKSVILRYQYPVESI